MDGSQSDISGTSAIFASAFQVIEKEANEGRVEILDPELGRHFVKSFFGKLQKQAETIAISRDGMRTRLPLAKQAIGVRQATWWIVTYTFFCRPPPALLSRHT